MSDSEPIGEFYGRMAQRIENHRVRQGGALTLAEKVLLAHLVEHEGELPERGADYAELNPDRVAMQDATAQMAMLQFQLTGRQRVALPTTVHCDHLIRARRGKDDDLALANRENKEVYAFLKSASARYGIGFWEPGAGIIHQVVLENYAFPGGMMIGTDSHTPNAGGLGMVAVGVGGADAMEVMAGLPFTIRWPKLIGVHLKGSLSGWASPKDVILKLLEVLTVKGGTGAIVEYFGPGCDSISATGKGTICNMGAELGATTSLFPFDEHMAAYLEATGREAIARAANSHADLLRADPEVEANPHSHYDQVIEIDLDRLEPLVVGPHTPDLVRPLSQWGAEAEAEGWPLELKAALIGSCTNSSYEDMERAASVARQAEAAGLKVQTPFLVTPGSDTIDQTIHRDGQMEALQAIGGTVLANACGPCIGQWERDDIQMGEVNSILTSYNRNFSGRNDANHQTLSFISSPEVVTAMALAGRLDFDPLKDTLTAPDGKEIRLEAPTGEELPDRGFERSLEGYIEPPSEGGKVAIEVDDDSQRLQLLEPFAAPGPDDFSKLPVLVKVAGKCTTDHISPAGPWLRFWGHLDHISDNMFSGAANTFAQRPGHGVDMVADGDGEAGDAAAGAGEGEADDEIPLNQLARRYKARGLGWVAVGDVNYGEGSSREHAAMSPRFLGCRAVIARSFARIAETNLKKQGILPLVFDDPADWELVRADDRLTLTPDSLEGLGPDCRVTVEVTHGDGSTDSFVCGHSLDELQVAWFRAGSALNHLREQNEG